MTEHNRIVPGTEIARPNISGLLPERSGGLSQTNAGSRHCPVNLAAGANRYRNRDEKVSGLFFKEAQDA